MSREVSSRSTPEERFWRKVKKTRDCWLWIANRNPKGYGRFWLNGRLQQAHRVVYEWYNDFIPEGLEIDHLWRNRGCVRPIHLEAVTCQENARRGETGKHSNSKKSHCPQGHPYSGNNLYIPPSGGRFCKKCHRQTQRVYKRRKLMLEEEKIAKT